MRLIVLCRCGGMVGPGPPLGACWSPWVFSVARRRSELQELWPRVNEVANAARPRERSRWSRFESRRSPCCRREHKPVSQPRAARADADGPFNMGIADAKASLFSHPCRAGLAEHALMLYVCPIEARPNDLASPRYTRRTNDLPPNLERNRAARLRQPIYPRT
jgi:hypothetical protein